ncbi:MAG: S8 family serine peptidase [Flavobacteriales bacterium]|nr:S8 family serine peptidase [Flavobacteriales bacterium]
MKRILLPFVVGVGFMVAALTGGNLSAQTVHKDYIDGQIWFRLKSDKPVELSISKDGKETTDLRDMKLSSMPYLRDVFTAHTVTNLSQPFPKAYGSDDLLRTYLLEFSDINNADNIVRELEESGAVVYAEKVPLMTIDLTPNDPLFNSSNMWGLFQINAQSAWNVSTGSSSIVVATTDNAIQITHPDLANVLWINTAEASGTPGVDDDGNGYVDDINGYDVGDNDNNPNPPSTSFDHGTHVAGTTGAQSNNATGVASIGYGISIMAVKSTKNSFGSNSVSNGYDGIYYAALNNADIINCSWGGSVNSPTGQNVVNWASSQGSIIVAAAGNDGTDNDSSPHYPSNYSATVAVASSTTGDVKSSFSNYGANSVDITAPGSNIASTVPNNTYAFMSGTSMATPMVSGLLGLMKSLNPSMPNSALLNCLYSTAVNIDGINPTYAGKLGAGRIDAFAAMNCVASTLSNPPTADFIANYTTITAGGSVTFTDQSTFGPTTWSWNFDNQSLGGVTPATASTQGPHVVTYSTPGVYEVSLTVTNANGNDTEIKTGYITVTTPGACSELNLDDNQFSTATSIHVGWNPALYTAGAGNGYVAGINVYGDKAKAEYFPAAQVGSNTQFVEGLYIWLGRVYSSNPNKTVNLNVWDATGGMPTGAPIGTRTITLGDVMGGGIYYFRFPTPVALPASSEIAVGVDFSTLSWTGAAGTDSFAIVTSTTNEAGISTGVEQWSDNSWNTYATGWSGSTWHHYIFPQLTANPASASITTSATTICEGDQVHYDATGSTFQDTLLWSFPGQTPAYSTNIQDSLIYSTAGTYTTYLEVIGGGCSNYAVDSVTITVNPTPTPSITASADTICSGNSVTLSTTGGGTYAWTPGGSTASSISPSPTSNTTYSVAVTSGGCTGEAFKTIYVNVPPTASAAFTPSGSICVGDSVYFDGTGSTDANSYSWSFPAGSPSSSTSTSPFPLITFGAGGTHSYSLVVSNICGTDTYNGSVVINALPSVVANASPGTSICQGNQVTLTGSGTATGYSWDNGVTNGVAFTPSVTTTYTVTGTDGNGCENTDQITITVNICTGVEELEADQFAIYPNPTNNIINVVGLDNAKAVTLLDVTGKVVYMNTNINATSMVIDLSNASKGLYFLQVQTGNELNSYKVVKD